MAQRDLEQLSVEECFALLHEGHVGRLVYVDDDGPAAVPVNYAISGRDILLRVEGGAKQAAIEQDRLAFEVDHVDENNRSGWSVLVRGAGDEVPLDAIAPLIRGIEGLPPMPWVTGIHNVWLRISPSKITGRRLGRTRVTALY
jgi:hypothetical protein